MRSRLLLWRASLSSIVVTLHLKYVTIATLIIFRGSIYYNVSCLDPLLSGLGLLFVLRLVPVPFSWHCSAIELGVLLLCCSVCVPYAVLVRVSVPSLATKASGTRPKYGTAR